MRPRDAVLLFLLLSLVLGAAAVLGLDARARRRHEARAEEFQRLVGGLGFGPALDLSGGPNRFDPRLDGRDADEVASARALSIFSYPPPDRPTAPPGD
jgi:hypothetical protein